MYAAVMLVIRIYKPVAAQGPTKISQRLLRAAGAEVTHECMLSILEARNITTLLKATQFINRPISECTHTPPGGTGRRTNTRTNPTKLTQSSYRACALYANIPSIHQGALIHRAILIWGIETWLGVSSGTQDSVLQAHIDLPKLAVRE